MKLNRIGMLGVCLAAAAPGAPAQAPHAHGTGELLVAVEKGRLDIEFRSPLDNLVGFEHAPRTDAQRAAVKAMTARLNRPETLFKLPQAASCTAGPAQIDSPLDAPAAPSKSAKPAHKPGDDDHAELTATFRFACADPGKLDSIEVAIFDAFPRTTAIKAQIIGPRGQSAARLSPKRRVIRL